MAAESNVLVYGLKNNQVFRCLIKPFMDVYRINRNKRYYGSEDSMIMQSLKGKYQGKRCFIIGNGPSLRADDLDKLKKEVTFGTNRIFHIFDKTQWRPTYYLAVDSDFIQYNYEEIKAVAAKYLFLSNIYHIPWKLKTKNMVSINEYGKFPVNKWNDTSAFVSEDVSKYFSIGYTVTFTAIQLALYMGFKEIYLLGVDFNYSSIRDAKGRIIKNDKIEDYFDGKKYHSSVLNYHSAVHAYQMADQYCRDHSAKICDATRSGKLNVFEKVVLEDVIEKSMGENS